MSPHAVEVGENLRRVRSDRQMSLTAVASEAGISAATLSRVETGKQSLDVSLLLTLARILGVPAGEMLAQREAEDDLGSVTRRLAELPPSDRTRAFLEASHSRRNSKQLGAVVDDLLSTIDVLREELMNVHRRIRRGRNR